MKILRVAMPEYQYEIKCPYEMRASEVKGITLHDTYNSAPARNEIAYMQRNENEVSYHFAVDEDEAIQGVPLDRNTWNAGDGEDGFGNRNTISIEMCRSRSDLETYKKARANAIKLTAQLLIQYKLTPDDVYKHQDHNDKYCPHRTLDLDEWDYVLDEVKKEYNRLKNIKPTANAQNHQGQYHVVKRGDTLFEISKKYLGDGKRYGEIKALNKLDSNVIYSGTKLAIPGKVTNTNVQTPSANELYKVEVGSFTKKESAEKLFKELKSRGYNAKFITQKKETPKRLEKTEADYKKAAQEIYDGENGWGTGELRRKQAKERGFDPEKLQDYVDELF